MPRWRSIIIVGTILIGSLLLCALGANVILNFQSSSDVLTTGVIIFFVLIPVFGAILSAIGRSIPGIARLIAYLIRTRHP